MKLKCLPSCFLFLSAFCLWGTTAFAQSSIEMGKLKIHVQPKQAYVFVDGKAIRDGSQTVDLAAGDHKVGVYNYGYVSKTQQVHIGAGDTTTVRVALQSSGDMVSGPFADIEFKGHPRAAVLLNGQTPDYFVGHVDEFNWNWIWHQRLLVKPGTYNVTVTREGNKIWSGEVTAKAGKQVTVYLDQNGATKTKDWKEGLTMGPQPRFHAGIASATVPIAPVTVAMSAASAQVGCAQPTTLKWNSTDAADTTISGIGEVPNNGERSVSPMHDTTYLITAKGPGGEANRSITVEVKGAPIATLAVSQPELRYHKIGDRVVEQGSATVKWSASNANSVRVEPFNSDAMTGSEEITPIPNQTALGPVNQDVTYTISAANACGETTTKTATLHIVGSIDPPPATTLASLFYPTAYPTRNHPNVGLVASEQMTLGNAATQFRTYSMYDDKASLVIVGHADVRGSEKYNKALSERRAALVKEYLTSHGVAADKIQTQAEGKDQPIGQNAVEALLSGDEPAPAKWMSKHQKATWLAYNRRTDIVLEPSGKTSTKIYPVQSADARLLWQRSEPSLKKVELASGTTAKMEQASLARAGK
jgi:OmpA family/PEGA domain